MKTLLLISSERNGGLGEVNGIPGLRVIARHSVAEAAPAVKAGAFDLALVVSNEWTTAAAEQVHRLREAAPTLRIVVATEGAQALAAYGAGGDAVLPWPESSPVLPQVMRRWMTPPPGVPAGVVSAPTSNSSQPWATVSPTQSPLEILRAFSRVLSHSLDEQSLAQRLVDQLAEILGVVRMALFLEPDSPPSAVGALAADPRLACVAATGIPPEVTSCVELSRDGGLGRLMTQRRGVVSRHSPHLQLELQRDPQIVQEFEVLGCDMAVAVRDRDKVLGVAVLGERITGQPFTTEELNLGYFLMGELGMAIRNSRLHQAVLLNHQLLSSILESITSGSLVIGPDLRVLHANRAAAQLLGLPDSRPPASSDLPPPVLQTLHAVATRGGTAEPVFHERRPGAAKLLRYSIIPLQGTLAPTAPRAVIVLIEDWTNIQAAKQAEIESANSRLITMIAARFAHEIRNSLVPLSTHSQLFASESHRADFLDSLRSSLHRETLRIRRLSDQMLFLAAPDVTGNEVVTIGELLNSALSAAQEIVSKPGQLVSAGDVDLPVRGTRASLIYALQEVLANSLQAVPGPATIRVKAHATTLDSRPAVAIEVSDSGGGFTPESASRATEPFFTTRTTGVGLGLAVARKIVEVHGGRLIVHERRRPEDSDIELILPAP